MALELRAIDSSERPSAETLIRWAAVLYGLLALGGLWWLSGGETIGVGLVAGDSNTAPTILIDIGLGVALGLGVVGLWRWLIRRPTFAALEQHLVELVGPLTGEQAWALALFSGIGEEIFFRGALLTHWGLLLSTLIFAMLHAGRTKVAQLWGVLAFVIGILLAGLTLWRGSLIPAIVAHTLINGLQLQRMGAEVARES